MENAQYDAIAEQYRRSKSSPVRRFIEEYTFMELVGDVRDQRVLDLACGEGFYTRRLKAAGAKSVLGVDISSEMIELARSRENAQPLGVDYLCADVAVLDRFDLGSFDIVVAAYLLHYAPDENALRRMCSNIAASLPQGGRFVTLNENPEQPAERFAGYEQYGFNKTAQSPLRDGAEITYWMIAGREMFQIHAHWFSRATYERALSAAGFRSIAWQPLRLDDAGIEAHGRDYWQEYLTNPPIVGIECRV
ncbi:MAG: class I SAM-dependent methyltransferase [Gammaproteobacteria bacterium]